MRPKTRKLHTPNASQTPKTTWGAKRADIDQKTQKAAALKNAQLQASQSLIYRKGKLDELCTDAANVMLGIGTVLNSGQKGQALIRGTNARNEERVATKGFSVSRFFFKNTKAEKEAGASQLNDACRILMAHPNATIRDEASNLLGYIHLKKTTHTPALKDAVNRVNQAVRDAAKANQLLTRN